MDSLQGRVRRQWQKVPPLEALGKARYPWYEDWQRLPFPVFQRKEVVFALGLEPSHHTCCAKDWNPFIPKQELPIPPIPYPFCLNWNTQEVPLAHSCLPASWSACLTLHW